MAQTGHTSQKKKKQYEREQEAKQLAAAGANHTEIFTALGITKTTYWRNKALVKSVNDERGRLRKRLSVTLIQRAIGTDKNEPSDKVLLWLSQRLGLYDQAIPFPKVTNAKEAAEAISEFMVAAAEASIPEYKIGLLSKLADSYIKAYELANVEERLAQLEAEWEARIG